MGHLEVVILFKRPVYTLILFAYETDVMSCVAWLLLKFGCHNLRNFNALQSASTPNYLFHFYAFMGGQTWEVNVSNIVPVHSVIIIRTYSKGIQIRNGQRRWREYLVLWMIMDGINFHQKPISDLIISPTINEPVRLLRKPNLSLRKQK